MTPSLTQNDLTDGIVTETKISSNICHAFASGVSGTDGDNHLGVQGLAVSPGPKRMPRISLRVSPFEVAGHITSSDKVNMVDLGHAAWISDERHGDQYMHAEMSGVSLSIGKGNSKVSIFVGIGLKHSWVFCYLLGYALPVVSDYSSQATDAAKAGNFVKTIVARYGEPDFAAHSVFPIFSKSSLPGDGVNTRYHRTENSQCL